MKGAGIGLVGLLIVAAITFWIMFGGKDQGGGYVRTELETRAKETEIVNNMGGKDASGALVTDSITYVAEPDRDIVITTIEKNSPFDTKYGIRAGDKVLELGPLPIKGMVSTDAEARDQLINAFQHSFQIVVDRGGQKLTLPDDRQTDPAAGATATAPPTAAAPAPAQPKREGPMGAAHDLVNQIETH